MHLNENTVLAEVVERGWPHPVSNDLIKFALSVKYKEGKRQYYSLKEQKISTSDSKRHDKRWEQINEYHDGKFASVMGLLCMNEGWTTWIDRFAMGMQLMDAVDGFYFHDDVRQYFDLDKDTATYVRQAYQAIDLAVLTVRTQQRCDRTMECLIHNVQNHFAIPTA